MGAYVLSLPRVEVGVLKITIFEILEWERKFTLGLNAAKIVYANKEKKLRTMRAKV